MSKPVVAIVGRPNVGKSTLFNRLVGRRKAVVADVPGVTRDRIYNDVEWNGRVFTLVDTGGLFLDDSEFRQEVHEQVSKAISEADVVILVVDGEVGPVPEDEEIARMLLKMRKKTIVVANKVDDFRDRQVIYDFLVLGLGEPLPLSALHGLNIDELLDRIVSLLPGESYWEEEKGIHIAVVGRPNVGKSSLVNALLKEKRLIVSDIPGTTRDAVDTVLKRDEKTYILVDTAGIRRKSRISDDVEYYGVKRSLRAIDRSDIVLFVLDATQGVVEQDTKIGGYIADAGKGLIIIINKWDLAEKEQKAKNTYEQLIRWRLDFLSFAPLHYVSALTGQGVDKILPLVDRVYGEYTKRISTGNLNSWLMETVYLNPPPAAKGLDLKFYYAVQAEVAPPLFVFFVNRPEMVHFSYRRYLENQLRKAYGFEGTPVRLIFRKRE